MKKIFFVFYTVAAVCLFSGNIVAQEKQKATIHSLKQNGNTVALTVTSPNEFYMGGNKHILHIGNKDFDLYDQVNDDGSGSLKFFIPVSDFKALKDGERIYLSYGEMDVENVQEAEAICKQSYSACWSLGKLNKKQLK